MSHATSAPGWPVVKGVQNTKEISYVNMKSQTAARQLDKLWSDDFLTNAGIYAAGSTAYTYQGTPNFNVIKTQTAPNVVPTMSANNAPSPCVASASSEYDFNYAAWKAFEKINAAYINAWVASATPTEGSPQWLKIDLGSGNNKTVTNIIIRNRSDTDPFSPKSFIIEGSTNDSTWNTLLTVSNDTNNTSGAQRSFNLSQTGSYRYYRITITAANGGGLVSIGELELYEALLATASIVSVLALDLAANITQAIMFADVTLGTGTAAYYVSTDDGSTWTSVTLETLASVPAGKQIRLKVELTGNAALNSWGVAV